MARTLVALLAVAAAFAVVDARLMHATDASRSLLGLQRCPAGCASDGCVADSTGGGYKCTKCKNRLVVNTEDGTCGCPAGRWNKNTDDCDDCDKGSYCLGGLYNGTLHVPNEVGCGVGMTTIGKRSTAVKACVNDLGYSYKVAADGTPSVDICPINTYGPGLKKQRACVPCPAGYITRTNGQYSSKACVVPQGYYLKGPGQVAPCPKGEYKAGFAPDAACTKCAAGVSTPAEASTSEAACTVVLPGFYPSVYTNSIVKATEKCPQKFFCAGGSPTKAFNTTTPAVLDGTTVAACDYGTWTQDIGSTSANQCMTPPGYYTTVSDGTVACSSGQYRADWKPASAAGSCSVCGEGILSEATEQLTEYAIADATPSIVAVRATAASCYIMPGQGMYYSAATSAYRAVNCDSNNYGVANTTFGLAAFPCRDCPANMITGQALTTSGSYFVSTDGVHQGFTSPKACVTKAGYGYNGRVATKCQQGWWNPTDTYSTCTQCAFGLSTQDDATKQIDSANCTLAPGYGFHDGAIVACPIGFYNSALRSNTSAACETCPEGLSTSQAGAAALGDCNVCALGYGGSGSGTTCSSQCGGNAATYGPAGRDAGSTCEACPAQTTGFSFDYLAQNQNFTPSVVARVGADSAADCLSEFAQIVDSAWYLGGSAVLQSVPSATSFAECVADCHGDDSCQYITYDYDAAGDKCSKKQAGAGSVVVAFKAVVAGDVTASKVKGKSLASGSYTFWKEASATAIGADATSDGSTTSVQACLSSCDDSADCAGVAMLGMTSATSAPSLGCKLIKGDASIATFKRSMTKTKVDRLSLSALSFA